VQEVHLAGSRFKVIESVIHGEDSNAQLVVDEYVSLLRAIYTYEKDKTVDNHQESTNRRLKIKY
jgi:hypothetical protein